MKLFIEIKDTNEIVFIPSFLIVDNFKKLMRKKDRKYKRVILHYIIEFLIVDKKNKKEGFNINFSTIEESAAKYFIKKNNAGGKVEGKLIAIEGDGIGYNSFSKPGAEFSELFKDHQRLKQKSGIITFEHIINNDFSRNFFFHKFQIDFQKRIRKERAKDIERYVIGSSLFYTQFFEEINQNSIWFSSYKKKNIVIDWVVENTANLIVNKKEDLNIHKKSLLLELFGSYLVNKHSNFPIYKIEDFKKLHREINKYVSLSKQEINEEIKKLENNFKTFIPEVVFYILKLYIELLNDSKNKENIILVMEIFNKILKSNISEETDFNEESQFLFNQKNSIESIQSEKILLNTDTLVYLESRLENQDFVCDFYDILNKINAINLNQILPLVKDKNSKLSKKIVEDYWIDLTKLITKKFSDKSNTYERVMTVIVDSINSETVLEELLAKKRTNYHLAADFFDFYKKRKSKKEITFISEKILNEVNFKKFDEKRRRYFELIDSDVLINYFLSLDRARLKDFSNEEGLLQNILQINNKSLIPKLLAAMQLVEIKLFENFPKIVSSKYFWSAFEFNLRSEQSISNNIHITKSDYFKSFLLKSEGVNWLKSEVGQFWLSLPTSESWKNSSDGIFIQKIVLQNQNFFIETKEVFNSYVEILQTISKQEINESYLINYIPETLNYILKQSPESILLIDYENFDRYVELINIIKDNPNNFLQNKNNDVVLQSISCFLHEASYKPKKEEAQKIIENLEYFYKNNPDWFMSDNFALFLKKHNPDDMYSKLFDKTITGLSKLTKKIADNLIKSNENKYLQLLIKRNLVPFWITGNVSFVESIKKTSKESRKMVNLIGEQYFYSNFKSATEHREWFTEFSNLFAFKNKKNLKPQLITALNRDCNSQKCGTKKTTKPKEGFRDFYDVFLAISFYADKHNQVQRPYRCLYSKLWHKTSDWG